MKSILKYTLLNILAISLVAVFSNCHSGNTIGSRPLDTIMPDKKVKPTPIAVKKDTLISDTLEIKRLQYGFTLKVRDREGTGKYRPTHYMEIWHKDFKIFTDTSDTSTGYNFDKNLTRC
jgi:hypothetical protein